MISEKDLDERIFEIVHAASSSASGPLTPKDIRDRVKSFCPGIGGPDVNMSIGRLIEGGRASYYHSGYQRLVPANWLER